MPGFVVQPKRWIVARTFGWLSRSRRLRKGYEYLPATSEAMIHVTMIRLMLKRLTPPICAFSDALSEDAYGHCIQDKTR